MAEHQEKLKLLAFQYLRSQGDSVYCPEQKEIEEIQHRLQQLYISRPAAQFFTHQMESCEWFYYKVIRFLSDDQNSINNIFPKEENAKKYYIKLCFEDPTISPYPTNNNGDIITTDIAYMKNITYSTTFVCKSIKLIKVFITDNDVEEQKLIVEYKPKDKNQQIILFKIPTMVRSKWCVSNKKNVITNLDKSDPGCFFICNGQSKTITPIERSPNNKIITFRNVKKGTVNAVVNSVSFTSEYTNKNILQVIYSTHVKFQGKENKDVSGPFLFVETSQFDNQGSQVGVEKDKITFGDKEGDDEENQEEKVQINDSKDKPSVFLLLAVLGVCKDSEIIQLCTFGDERVKLELEQILQRYRMLSAQGSITTQQQAEKFLQSLKSGKLQMKLVQQIIISDILPHCCDSKNVVENYTTKAQFLGLMVYKVLCVFLGIVGEESRDSYLNKRVVGVGELLYQRFESIYKKSIVQNLRTHLFNHNSTFINQFGTTEYKENPKTLEEIRNYLVDFVINKNNITTEMENSIITGKWSSVMSGIAKQLPNSSIPARTAALKMISNAPIFKKQQHGPLETRYINNNQIGFQCPVGSPDGPQCGQIKEMSISCDITIDYSQCRNAVKDYIGKHPSVMLWTPNLATKQTAKIFIFGKLTFLTRDLGSVIEHLRQGRFKGDAIPRYVTYEIQGNWNELLIYGDSGRMIRPLLVLNDQQQLNNHKELYKQLHSLNSWEDFVKKFPDSVEWCDIQELSNKTIAASAQILLYNNKLRKDRQGHYQVISPDVKDRFANVYQRFNLLELHPINILGINPSTIPYAHCNYAPRNIFAFVQMKRGVQKPYSDNDLRQDINQFLVLGSAPLIQTMTTNLIGSNRNFNGSNICVAVLMENGFQQEDSITISSRLARTNYLQCKQDIIEEVIMKQQQGSNERLCRPDKFSTTKLTSSSAENDYSKLDDLGLVKEGSVVRRGDVIIGKIAILNQNDQEQIIDKSIKFDYEEGIIIKVKQLNLDGQQQKIIIRFIVPLYPQIGDKYAARCGQKGTIGTIRDENLMPYTEDGVPIDIIINPCSFCTRMTIGMNIEHYTSYLAIHTGMFLDASMFCDVKSQLERTLQILIEKHGTEGREALGQKKVFSPLTGECIDYAQVGFVFYAAQEQKASSKLYAVGYGEAARNQVFQPREGGKNHGGSRLGEMEMAGFLSAGLSNVIKVFAQQHSDGFQVKICSSCGLYASRDDNQNKWYCKNCQGKSDVVTTQIQYSSKHLKDLLNSLGLSINYMPNKIN